MQSHLPVRAISYLKTHIQKKRWRRVVTALSCVVVFCTTYALILPAITMSQPTFCGKEAHTHDAERCCEQVLICGYEAAGDDAPEQQAHVHTDACYQEELVPVCGFIEGEGAHFHTADCYDAAGDPVCGLEESLGHRHTSDCYQTEWVLICGLEERTDEDLWQHVHTDACYETRLICEQEEHQHSLICYSDPQADLESAAVWERTIPQALTDDLAANVAAVASSQLGYAQSSRNYCVDENGGMHGYTRYGAWFGDPYGEWCAMFASFCLHYAGVEPSVFPYASGCIYWTEQLTAAGLYAPAGAASPKTGDLIFFDPDGDRFAEHVGIVTDVDAQALTTVEGNIGGCVVTKAYAPDDASILGFGVLPVSAPDTPDAPEPGVQPVCGLEEHTHSADCYNEEGLLLCTLPQHTHTEACYAQQAEKTPLCGLDEHTHTTDCYDADGALVCALAEHTHTEACYVQQAEKTPLCGLAEHTHTADCYDADGTLVCTLAEHTHTEACYLPQEPVRQDFSYDDTQLHLRVTVESPQPLPEGTALTVQAADDDRALLSGYEAGGAEQWIIRQLGLTQAETPVDISEMTLTAEVLVKDAALSSLFAQADEAAPDAGVTVSVMQADGDAGLQEVESVTVAPGEAVPALTVTVQDGTLVLLASSANPEFTVQYYAQIPRFSSEGHATLTIFDTSGKQLPTNAGPNPTKELYLTEAGTTTGKNAGIATQEYVVATELTLTRMYADHTFEYVSAPEPMYVDKLLDNAHYQLKELWVLKTGRDSGSTDAVDWDIYAYSASLRFTNRQAAAEQDPNLIYIRPGNQTVLRLVYDTAKTDFTTPATFYDYDISSGYSSGYWQTATAGINQKNNYGTSANGQTTWTSYCDVLAFGNWNCGTGMGNYKFAQRYLNRFSGSDFNCTFSLAKELRDGKIVYNEWLIAPKLFNDGDANGKHTYSGSSLTFRQEGDTYTLCSAAVAGLGSIDGLDKLFNPSPNTSTIYTQIFTNDFWPLDTATEKTDPLFGGRESVSYRGYASADNVRGSWRSETGSLPGSDDGRAHNSFFGMQYAVEFTLTPDYVGPLEYTFFGDDDMWVFLDDTLVCDLGGVHSSVGEYVNLWDYLDQEGRTEIEKHTLTIFYTERGASGSTCYMNFTLPSVSGLNIKQTTGGLMVYKEVAGEADPEQEFTFHARFYRASGEELTDDHTCYRYDANGVRIGTFNLHSGSSFQLKAGEHLEILNLPVGTSYTITETAAGGYTTTYTVNGVAGAGTAAAGVIVRDTLNELVFTNTQGSVPLTLQKLDQDGRPLPGAVFQLLNADGETVTAVKEADGRYRAVSSADEAADPTQALEVSADGMLRVTDLLPGSYTLRETTVPEGFRDSLGDVSIRIAADGTVSLTKPNVFAAAEGDGLLLKITNQHKDISLTLQKQLLHSDTTQTFTFTVSYTTPDGSPLQQTVKLRSGEQETLTLPYGSEVTITEARHDGFAVIYKSSGITLDSDNDSCSLRITGDILITAVNSAGYALPSTGGHGAGWFMTAGLLLLCGAVGAGICHRKRRDAH